MPPLGQCALLPHRRLKVIIGHFFLLIVKVCLSFNKCKIMVPKREPSMSGIRKFKNVAFVCWWLTPIILAT
jgi:hypothetical protein